MCSATSTSRKAKQLLMRPFIHLALAVSFTAGIGSYSLSAQAQPTGLGTTTPIRHLVVIFQENISFDHYFGTYPNAANLQGEPKFTALPNTPAVNGLTAGILTQNPNLINANNGAGAANPFRLSRAQSATADQNHNYGPEQAASHGGLMDLFPSKVGVGGAAGSATMGTALNMGYYDGNTVTAL